jgi:hypothetical protein
LDCCHALLIAAGQGECRQLSASNAQYLKPAPCYAAPRKYPDNKGVVPACARVEYLPGSDTPSQCSEYGYGFVDEWEAKCWVKIRCVGGSAACGALCWAGGKEMN